MKLLEVMKGDFAKLATLVRKTKMLNEIVIETLQKVCRDVALYEFKKGERLFKQGAHAKYWYIIASGGVSLTIDKKLLSRGKMVQVLGPGGFTGEDSFLYSRPQLYSATCDTPVKAWVFNETDFRRLLSENAKFRKILKEYCVEREVKIAQIRSGQRSADLELSLGWTDSKNESKEAKALREEREGLIDDLIKKKVIFEINVRHHFMAVTLGPAFKSLTEAHRLGFSKLLLAYAQAKSREVEQLVFLHPKTKNKIGTFSSGRFEWERPK